jgi:hypothetical protein
LLNSVLIIIAVVHLQLLAALVGRAVRKLESGRAFPRQQVWRATAVAVAAQYAPEFAGDVFARSGWTSWSISSLLPELQRGPRLVIAYALCFAVQWIVFRTCLHDASGLPLSRRGNLWMAGLSTFLSLGVWLLMLTFFVLVLRSIRGP